MEAKLNESYVPPPRCGSSKIPPKILNAELETICKRRKTVSCESSEETPADCQSAAGTDNSKIRDKLVGLALSGGGIRSATFSLGVMQKLAKEGCLKHVDYLSTVSGGGYIGGSLTWLLSDKARKLKDGGPWNTSNRFPYGTDDPREVRQRNKQSNILRHLRLHGKYLIPGKGITTTSLIAVILRGILLNLVVWLPLAVFLMVVLLLLSGCSWDAIRSVPQDIWSTVQSMDVIRSVLEDIRNAMGNALIYIRQTCNAKNEGGLDLLLYIAGLMGIVFFFASVLYSLSTWKPILRIFNHRKIPRSFKNYEILRTLKSSYLCRRIFEKWIRWPLWIGLSLLVLGSLPAVTGWLDQLSIIQVHAFASFLLGVLGGAWSYYHSGRNGKIPIGVLAPLASILFIYGLAWASHELACLYIASKIGWSTPVLLVGVGISLATGLVVNLNYISIHRYYRDRLMEAFMPNPNVDAKNAAATNADGAELSTMCSAYAPYHLVNTNVVLVNSRRPRLRKRGGDAFLLSPKYCGSTATGWVKTAAYMQKDALTLATAVAISGAAANPNTAAGGSGPTRKPLLSLLMSLLNVRLGYWVPNPGKRKAQRISNHFCGAYHEVSPRGYAEHQKLLQISDGGHFESLGVYELVRRRVKLIICCDGSADPEFEFKDLQVLVRRIGTDFGARIKFDCYNHLERLIPRDPDPQKIIDRDPETDAYPVGIKFAERGYIKGKIVYPDGTKSTLILLKTTMIQGLGLLLKGYKGANPDFPDQSTADQFFDEEQFEAYRKLGYQIAENMIADERVGFQCLLRACE